MSNVSRIIGVGLKQDVFSRLELGLGGTIELAFKGVSFYQFKAIRTHMIFAEPFNEEWLYVDPNEQLIKELNSISGIVDKFIKQAPAASHGAAIIILLACGSRGNTDRN